MSQEELKVGSMIEHVVCIWWAAAVRSAEAKIW